MVGRFLRVAGLLTLAVWAIWEGASEAPVLLLWFALAAALGLMIDFLVSLPRELRRERARRDSRSSRPRQWPSVPWGLDPISAPAGVAIGLATQWWIGLAVWVLLTTLLWAGWIWTRQFSDGEAMLSPRGGRVVGAGVITLMIALFALVVIQAAVKWGEAGLMTALLGLGTWSFGMDRLVRRADRATSSDGATAEKGARQR